MVTCFCLGFPFALVPTLTFLASSLTVSLHSKIMCVVLFLVSLKELVFWGSWLLSLLASLLLRCYYTFVLQIFEYCSLVWGSAAECHLQLLELQVYSVARLCPDQCFLLCHRRHVAALCMLYKVNSNSNHCLVSEFLSASSRVRPQLILWSSKYESGESPNVHGVSCRPVSYVE